MNNAQEKPRIPYILEARQLGRVIRQPDGDRAVVDDFTFSFHAGQVYSVLGPSGAGKSSLLRLLNRLDEPTTGEVLFNGQDYREIPPCTLRRQIGYLFQTPYLFAGTIGDNLRLANPDITDELITKRIHAVSLKSLTPDHDVANLSVGEKQRVALARLSATDPKVVLLDEPTAALDPAHTEKIESLIKHVAEDHQLAVIFVSHNPNQARRLGGQGLLLVNGKLVEHGPVAQLVDNPQTELGQRYRNRELT